MTQIRNVTFDEIEVVGAVVPSATGLRTSRRISHPFLMDVPAYPRPFLVTDAAINIAPGPGGQGRHRAERHRPCFRLEEPRLAVLSAVELLARAGRGKTAHGATQ